MSSPIGSCTLSVDEFGPTGDKILLFRGFPLKSGYLCSFNATFVNTNPVVFLIWSPSNTSNSLTGSSDLWDLAANISFTPPSTGIHVVSVPEGLVVRLEDGDLMGLRITNKCSVSATFGRDSYVGFQDTPANLTVGTMVSIPDTVRGLKFAISILTSDHFAICPDYIPDSYCVNATIVGGPLTTGNRSHHGESAHMTEAAYPDDGNVCKLSVYFKRNGSISVYIWRRNIGVTSSSTPYMLIWQTMLYSIGYTNTSSGKIEEVYLNAVQVKKGDVLGFYSEEPDIIYCTGVNGTTTHYRPYCPNYGIITGETVIFRYQLENTDCAISSTFYKGDCPSMPDDVQFRSYVPSGTNGHLFGNSLVRGFIQENQFSTFILTGITLPEGKLTYFEAYMMKAEPNMLQVWREVDARSGKYKLVADVTYTSKTTGAVKILLDEPLIIRKGDYLGFTVTGTPSIALTRSYNGAYSVVSMRLYNSEIELPIIGEEVQVQDILRDYQFSLRASIETKEKQQRSIDIDSLESDGVGIIEERYFGDIMGPIGPKGPTGDQGLLGLSGSIGAAGLPGPTGHTGEPGDQGLPGESSHGKQGNTGDEGPTGPTGERGDIGLSGQTGPTGNMGPNASIGQEGVSGHLGEQGPNGQRGLAGLMGQTGSRGPTGSYLSSCHVQNGGCDHECIAMYPKHRCECYVGYKLADDGMTCLGQCQVDNGRCEQACVPGTVASSCTCALGYVISENRRSCNDVDECRNKRVCLNEEICLNMPGSYMCVADQPRTNKKGQTGEQVLMSTDIFTMILSWNVLLTIGTLVIAAVMATMGRSIPPLRLRSSRGTYSPMLASSKSDQDISSETVVKNPGDTLPSSSK